MDYMKKKTIIGFAVVLALVAGLVLMWIGNVNDSRKKALEIYTDFPGPKTIYDQNNNPHYKKTHIEIPKHEGYLIAVYKDQHKLKLYKNNEVIKEYDVNIKREFEDRKKWEDDQTPEGIFSIETMDVISNPPWERWMRVDTLKKAKELYVDEYEDGNERIVEFERKSGLIDGDSAIRKFNEQNSDQKMLRGIGIHGGGFSLYRDWTNGCVAMSDEDITELFGFLSESSSGGIGTLVVIQD